MPTKTSALEKLPETVRFQPKLRVGRWYEFQDAPCADGTTTTFVVFQDFGKRGSDFEPFPTENFARLSPENQQQVKDYLDKIKSQDEAFESRFRPFKG